MPRPRFSEERWGFVTFWGRVISSMIYWLNSNQGAAIVILTFVLACITGWYAFITLRMARIIEKQTAIQIEPIIVLDQKYEIRIVDNKVKLQIENDGTVNVVKLKLAPSSHVLQLPGGWTGHIAITRQPFKAKKLEPGGTLPIEFDAKGIVEGSVKEHPKLLADLALRLDYYREADHKPYHFEYLYKFIEGSFYLINRDS